MAMININGMVLDTDKDEELIDALFLPKAVNMVAGTVTGSVIQISGDHVGTINLK